MSKDEIIEKYPEAFKECWEFSTPDEWNHKIDQLIRILNLYRQRKQLEPLEIHQIKPKFGRLRFYIANETDQERKWISACENICDTIKYNYYDLGRI